MERIDIQNFNKYYRKNDGNATLARVGHVNAIIDELNNLSTGGGIGGTNYLFVAANGTPTENAAELQAAYDTLKTMSPSADNRLTLIAAPGEYQFASTFVLDTEFIDLVSLTGNRDVIFDLVGLTDPFVYDTDTFDILDISECLLIDADNVYVKGIKGKFYLSPEWDNYWGFGEDYNLPIQLSNNLPNIVVENCEGGPFSFGGDFTFNFTKICNGTFVNCSAQDYSFGGGCLNVSGNFINCKAIFYGTELSQYLFGGDGSEASGYFENCEGGFGSFGTYGSLTGIFKDCKGGDITFYGTTSGTLYNCIGGIGCYDTSGGGFYYSCTGGIQSWNFNSPLENKLYGCILKQGLFGTVSGGGVTVLCIDGNNQINTQN
jgi:hypothetical protein